MKNDIKKYYKKSIFTCAFSIANGKKFQPLLEVRTAFYFANVYLAAC